MAKSFYKWLDNKTDDENNWVKEVEGIRYFFCVDTIYEVFLEKADVSEKMMWDDDLDELFPIWKEYSNEHKPFKYTQDDIQDRIDSDNAEMQTRSMEMGWGGSFVSNSRGQRTYFPYDDY